MKVKASLNYLRISPRKIRLIASLISGMKVTDALREMEYLRKRGSEPVLKLLKSAVANAEHNFQLKKDDLVVSEAVVNQGPVLKRMMPRALGRSAQIRKRTSHLSIVLLGGGETVQKTKKSAKGEAKPDERAHEQVSGTDAAGQKKTYSIKDAKRSEGRKESRGFGKKMFQRKAI